MKKFIPIFIALLICSSCGEDFFETTLTVDPPPHEDQLVLHSFVKSNDTVMYVSLTKSTGILENSDNFYGAEYINDATVELFENGTLKYSFTPTGDEPFNYIVELNGEFGGEGNAYEIKATHDQLGTASAEQTMLTPPVLISAVFDEDGGIPTDYGYDLNAIDIVIDDPEGENFYEVILVAEIENNIYSRYIESNDINASEGLNQTILVDGASFDGKEYTLQIETDFDWEEGLRVIVRSISKDWFLYSKSLYDFRDTQDFGIFAEPVTVHTNLTNGLGVFAMGAESRIPVDEE